MIGGWQIMTGVVVVVGGVGDRERDIERGGVLVISLDAQQATYHYIPMQK